MSEASNQLNHTRPNLIKVAPLVASICWGYATVNILLGLGLYFIYNGTIAPIAIANVFSYQTWGVLYFAVGCATAWGLISNNWSVTRNTQIGGLIIKAIWALALLWRSFLYPQTLILTFVWLFFAYIQAVTYIHFMTEITVRGNSSA